MLRVAVPNKGSLSEAAAALLSEAGYRQRRERHELALIDPDNDVEFFFLRPRDIATYVAGGRIDVGVTGRDLLLDNDAAEAAAEVLALGFARSTFRFAALPGTATTVADLQDATIATSYPGLVRRHLATHDVTAEVVRLDGAVETAVRLGVADVVADVVETGRTLRAAGLEIFGEPILRSEAVVIRRDDAGDDPQVDQLLRRINGVVMARRYVMVDYDIRVEQVETACALTPGIESPTVSPLHDKGWVAVRAMIERRTTNQVMDQLWELGARGILVTDILACRV